MESSPAFYGSLVSPHYISFHYCPEKGFWCLGGLIRRHFKPPKCHYMWPRWSNSWRKTFAGEPGQNHDHVLLKRRHPIIDCSWQHVSPPLWSRTTGWACLRIVQLLVYSHMDCELLWQVLSKLGLARPVDRWRESRTKSRHAVCAHTLEKSSPTAILWDPTICVRFWSTSFSHWTLSDV